MHDRIAAATVDGAVGTELAGVGERRHLRPVAHLVGEAPADTGDHALIAQEAVHAHRVGGEQCGEFGVGDRGRFRAELVERWHGQHGVARDAPHAGSALLALLGEQQRGLVDRPVGELDRLEAEPGLRRLAASPSASRRAAAVRPASGAPTNVTGSKWTRRYLPRRPTSISGWPYACDGCGHCGLERSEVERREPGEDAPGELGGQALGVRLDLGHLGHRSSVSSASVVAGAFPDGREHGVERAEHRLRIEQLLLVAEQPDAPADERLLGVEFAGGDRHRRVPVLLHLHVLGVGRPCAERRLTVADTQVVGHVALGAVTHHLGHADAVRLGDLAHRVARGDLVGEGIDPVETEIADHGS